MILRSRYDTILQIWYHTPDLISYSRFDIILQIWYHTPGLIPLLTTISVSSSVTSRTGNGFSLSRHTILTQIYWLHLQLRCHSPNCLTGKALSAKIAGIKTVLYTWSILCKGPKFDRALCNLIGCFETFTVSAFHGFPLFLLSHNFASAYSWEPALITIQLKQTFLSFHIGRSTSSQATNKFWYFVILCNNQKLRFCLCFWFFRTAGIW